MLFLSFIFFLTQFFQSDEDKTEISRLKDQVKSQSLEVIYNQLARS